MKQFNFPLLSILANKDYKLTGSHYFQCATESSDIDFFGKYGSTVNLEFERLGFKLELIKNYNDLDCVNVYTYNVPGFVQVHVQLRRNPEKFAAIQECIKKLGIYHLLSKAQRKGLFKLLMSVEGI